jgi:hypothetical protein
VKVESSLGDIVDRLTILEIKRVRLPADQRANVAHEHRALSDAWEADGQPPLAHIAESAELARVNAELWDVEDALRDCEHDGRFDDQFVQLARSVYRLNDRRGTLKRRINQNLASEVVEEKRYGTHAGPTAAIRVAGEGGELVLRCVERASGEVKLAIEAWFEGFSGQVVAWVDGASMGNFALQADEAGQGNAEAHIAIGGHERALITVTLVEGGTRWHVALTRHHGTARVEGALVFKGPLGPVLAAISALDT